jgi:hypothetical protein
MTETESQAMRRELDEAHAAADKALGGRGSALKLSTKVEHLARRAAASPMHKGTGGAADHRDASGCEGPAASHEAIRPGDWVRYHLVDREVVARVELLIGTQVYTELGGVDITLVKQVVRPHDYQAAAHAWARSCFGEQAALDMDERRDRFCEEALELLQATGYPLERVLALLAYVYGRPAGSPAQEVGGTVLTLACLCQAMGVRMQDQGEAELQRVAELSDRIREKQSSKPVGAALPQAVPLDLLLKAFGDMAVAMPAARAVATGEASRVHCHQFRACPVTQKACDKPEGYCGAGCMYGGVRP